MQDALDDRGNAFKGTVSERNAFESSAPEGSLWVDTDGIKMIWRKGVSVFEPAVWRWSGTATQMNAFTLAPDGFAWFNTSNSREYVRLGGAWKLSYVDTGEQTLTGSMSVSGSMTTGVYTIRGGWVNIYFLTSGVSLTAGLKTFYASTVPEIRPLRNAFGTAYFSGGYPGAVFMRPDGTMAIAHQHTGSRTNPQGSIAYPLNN